MTSSTQIQFSYWSDPLCVWAFVAEEKLEAILAAYDGVARVEHRVVPVFGSIPWRFAHGPWASKGPEGRCTATREIAARFGRTGVTGEVWLKDPPASSWAPCMAIKAAFALASEGTVGTDTAVLFQKSLREAFFLRNVNVARVSAQLEIAEECRLPVAELKVRLEDGRALAAVWEDHNEREALRIQGSPTFVFDGGRAMLYGNVAETVIRATIDGLLAGIAPGSSRC